MCVILHKLEKNKPFTLDDIKNACKTNPDGFSFMFRDTLKPYKTLDADEFIKTYEIMLNNGDLENAEYFIHCRIATNGAIQTSNCHPFENEHFILYHNGIISEFANNKDVCDSLQFLRKYLSNADAKTETILKRFNENASSKFIAIRKATGEVIQSDNFLTDDETQNYISNDYYKPYTKRSSYYDYKYYTYDRYDDYDEIINYIYANCDELEHKSKKQLIDYAKKLEDFIYDYYY